MRRHGNPDALLVTALGKLRAGDVQGSERLLRQLGSSQPDFAPAQFNLALLLRHYLFDKDGAARAERHFDEMAAPSLSPTALQALAGVPRIEDTAPAGEHKP